MIQGFSSGLLGNRELIYETDLPSFQRDFASLKTLDHGYGPNIAFTRGSNATYFDADGVLQTASNDVARFDHDPSTGASLGLLIEESRTNSIRNSQAGGAVVGSPGTLPTNWSVVVGGLSSEVVGTGTAAGLAYVDIKISGTTTQTSSAIYYEAQNNIVASSGQTWTASHYVAIVGGSSSNITLFRTVVRGSLSTSNIVESISTNFTPTSSLARHSVVGTLADPTSVRVNGGLFLSHSSGVAIDITLRIAAPQLEQGEFATSYIPTTNAAATRAAGSAVVTPISSFYNQSEGTLFAEYVTNNTNNGVVSVTDNTVDNRIAIITANSPQVAPIGNVRVDGVAQASITIGSTPSINEVMKFIVAAKADDFQAARGGSLGTADTSGAMPTLTHLRLGTAGSFSSSIMTGHIRKVAYWPKRLTNTLLEQLTT